MESVSVIIPTKNAAETIGELIDGLPGVGEVVVVDSGSADCTVTIARQKGARIVSIRPVNFHHSRTRNLGACHASGDFLLFMTQDATPQDSQLVERMLEPFADAKVAITYARQIPRPDVPIHERFWYNYYFPEGIPPNEMYVSNCCAMYRRSVFDAYRFSEDVSMSEDKEIAARMKRDGWRIAYVPEAIIIHSHNLTLVEVKARARATGRALSESQGIPIYPLERLRYWLGETFYVLKHDPRQLPFVVIYEGVTASAVIRARYLKMGRIFHWFGISLLVAAGLMLIASNVISIWFKLLPFALEICLHLRFVSIILAAIAVGIILRSTRNDGDNGMMATKVKGRVKGVKNDHRDTYIDHRPFNNMAIRQLR